MMEIQLVIMTNNITYINKLLNINGIPIIKTVKFNNEFDYWYK